MPGPLSNPRYERFAICYAAHGNGTRAALEAGFAAGQRNQSAAVRAVDLMKREEIRQRVAELNAVAERKTTAAVAVDRAWVLNELILNAQSAREANDRSAANRALELVGKEMGMFVDRKLEMKSPLEALSAQELQALVRLIDSGQLLDITPVANEASKTLSVDIIDVSANEAGVQASDVPIEDEDSAI